MLLVRSPENSAQPESGSRLQWLRVAQNEDWQRTSRQVALMWSRVMREKILLSPAPVSRGKNGQ